MRVTKAKEMARALIEHERIREKQWKSVNSPKTEPHSPGVPACWVRTNQIYFTLEMTMLCSARSCQEANRSLCELQHTIFSLCAGGRGCRLDLRRPDLVLEVKGRPVLPHHHSVVAQSVKQADPCERHELFQPAILGLDAWLGNLAQHLSLFFFCAAKDILSTAIAMPCRSSYM